MALSVDDLSEAVARDVSATSTLELEDRRRGSVDGERAASWRADRCLSIVPPAPELPAPPPAEDWSYLTAVVDQVRPRWQRRAACRGLGAARFVPSGRGANGETYGAAKAVCAVCEVAYECFSFAVDQEGGSYGMWGGEVFIGFELSEQRRSGPPQS
jgi:hypothetical protein